MTKFSPRTHSAREWLDNMTRAVPGLWAAYERERLADPPPEGIFITEEAGARAFSRALIDGQMTSALDIMRRMDDAQVSRTISAHTTLACWRMTQGIYRVDPALYDALIETPLEGDIPSEILARLPEWCVYIETPGLHVESSHRPHPLLGAWARLDQHAGGRRDLVLLLDIEGWPLQETAAIPLGGTLQSGIESMLADWQQSTPGAAATVAAYVRPIVNLLLYLNAVGDVTGKHGQPGNPVPTRTRRDGWRLFGAEGLRVWDVGVRMGAALRAAYQAAETGTGGEHAGPRGHVRRAHWHGFRSGPKKRDDGSEIPTLQRRFDLRWLPPIPVNLPDLDNLPAVVRNV